MKPEVSLNPRQRNMRSRSMFRGYGQPEQVENTRSQTRSVIQIPLSAHHTVPSHTARLVNYYQYLLDHSASCRSPSSYGPREKKLVLLLSTRSQCFQFSRESQVAFHSTPEHLGGKIESSLQLCRVPRALSSSHQAVPLMGMTERGLLS